MNIKHYLNLLLSLLTAAILNTACIKDMNLYKEKEDENSKEEGKEDNIDKEESFYLYPFDKEIQNATTSLIIRTNKPIDATRIQTEIPILKYNKQWLLMLTQDDCQQSSYCRTWAAINGKPISSSKLYPDPTENNPDRQIDYYYHAVQLKKEDLPPTIIPAGKSLGSTDGTGNEVRFAFTAAIWPEKEMMTQKITVTPGFTKNYYRFYRGGSLVWDDVSEILNYGSGIAFHDVEVENVKDPGSILDHFNIAQTIIQDKLSGRGCKTLAEPNGNKTYIEAANQYASIQTITAQTQANDIYPFKVTNDLHKVVQNRYFNENPNEFKQLIQKEIDKFHPKERKGIHIGVHNTDDNWIKLLTWINNTYGKDGDDSVWFPCLEEYYEYNYYRIHGTTMVEQIDPSTLKLTINLPSGQYFYYPSITVNLYGISLDNIASIEADDIVTGLSYANFEEGMMVNIDCRKYLTEHAEKFIEQYEKDKSNQSNKADALYFVNILKESNTKMNLLDRLK
ncbi:hypothetical protein [Bacteroides sp.]|uniref:hypothetical protein n=1 Tax=Bacteroides sp. TaxID=29523 RepID=UPI00262A1997|nr:hypothetical protein [Bacteroides sp.]MDD3037764.1 hypothetical protein [Bacteroides sp.]